MSEKTDHLLNENKTPKDNIDYLSLKEKPSINGVELIPGMEVEDIGIQEMTPDMVTELYLEIMGFVL